MEVFTYNFHHLISNLRHTKYHTGTRTFKIRKISLSKFENQCVYYIGTYIATLKEAKYFGLNLAFLESVLVW